MNSFRRSIPAGVVRGHGATIGARRWSRASSEPSSSRSSSRRGSSRRPRSVSRRPASARHRSRIPSPVRTPRPAPPGRVGPVRHRRLDRGLRDAEQRQRRPTDRLQDQDNCRERLPIDIYRLGYYGGDGARQGRATLARRRHCRRTSRACLTTPRPGSSTVATGRVSASWNVSVDRGLAASTWRAHADRHRRRATTSRSSCATTPATADARVPDLGHHLAGLQQLRRQQLLHGRRQHGRRAFKVSYNRPFATRGDRPAATSCSAPSTR